MAQELRICEYRLDRGLDYYMSGLAGIMSRVGFRRGRSTHAYTKEIRKALETLVFEVWDRYEEYLTAIVEANIPRELTSRKARECFANLLRGLLLRFREKSSDLSIGARIRLMNMVIAAIAEMAQYTLPPIGVRVREAVFSRSGSGAEGPESSGEKAEVSS